MSSYVLNVAPGDMQWLKTPKREWYRTACAVLVFAAAVDTESDNISGDHKINRVDCRSKETTFPEWVARAKGLHEAYSWGERWFLPQPRAMKKGPRREYV